MGFGHRVYKNYDPRAKIMQKTCHEVLGETGIKDDPLLDVALELERIAHGAVRGRPYRRLDRPVERDIEDPSQKIGRPRQLYTGPTPRDYQPISRRK